MTTITESLPASPPIPVVELPEDVAEPSPAAALDSFMGPAGDRDTALQGFRDYNNDMADFAVSQRQDRPAADEVGLHLQAVENASRRNAIAYLAGVCGLNEILGTAIRHAEAHNTSPEAAIAFAAFKDRGIVITGLLRRRS